MAVHSEKEPGDDWSVDGIDPKPREDGQPGPPDSWSKASWFDRTQLDWWWKGKFDPCPVRPLGFVDGCYIFVTAHHEIRAFTAGALSRGGGLSDLFGGGLSWAIKHFPKKNEEGQPSGKLDAAACVDGLIRACGVAGYFDGSTPHRSVGVWRGPNRRPIVHAGDIIFHDGMVEAPGAKIDEALYVIGGARPTPTYVAVPPHGYEWQPCEPVIGRAVVAALEEWHWQDLEARDLYVGGLFCDMLGEAPVWRPHKFVRALTGSGKTTLLKYSRALLGGAAHPIQRTYSRAFLEQHFSGTSCALLLDEHESDTEADRVRKLFELVRLLSDEDGATGGRGTSGGKARRFDVHGTVTMVATVSETWRPQDRSRIVQLELRPLKARFDHQPATPEYLQLLIERAAEASPGLRARAIAKWDLFLANVKVARDAVMALGGNTRDGDQLGHLIAGWWTMTSDEPLNEDDVAELKRFRPYVMSLVEAEDGDDEPSDCFNTLLGLMPHNKWLSGEQFTVGQMIARGRFDDDGRAWRRALGTHGMRLDKLEGETWAQAWLCIANKHPGLDKLFVDYPQWRGQKRRQVLADLSRPVEGSTDMLEVKKGEGRMWFAGVQSRFLLVPPELLPSLGDEPT